MNLEDRIENIWKIGLVGGGAVGLQLLNHFSESNLTDVAFVVDINPNSLAMKEAKGKVPTYTDFKKAIEENETEYIFEVTGVKSVADQLEQFIQDKPIKLVTHEVSYIFLSVIEERNRKTKDVVVQDITDIQYGINSSLSSCEDLVSNIKGVADYMRMIALNAQIEAARVGQEGSGFKVVAQEMGKSAESIQSMTFEIEEINHKILTASEQIDASIHRLN